MTPGEESTKGRQIGILMPGSSERVAAHTFDTSTGLAWVDAGWNEPLNPTHPGHYLEGEVDYVDGHGWLLIGNMGDVTLRVIEGRPDGNRVNALAFLRAEFGGDISITP